MIKDEIRKICGACRHNGILDECNKIDRLYFLMNRIRDRIPQKLNDSTVLPKTLYRSMKEKYVKGFINGIFPVSNMAAYREFDNSRGIGDPNEGTNTIGNVELINARTKAHVGVAENFSQGLDPNRVFTYSFSFSKSISTDRDNATVKIMDTSEFIRRLNKAFIFSAIEAGHKVDYTFVGELEYEMINGMYLECDLYTPDRFAFRKDSHSIYESQREFRIAFFVDGSYVANCGQQVVNKPESIPVNLGDISDIVSTT